jgi:lactoylglutathione lyase
MQCIYGGSSSAADKRVFRLPRNHGGLLMRVKYAIVFVSDMKRAVSFYRDVMGLPMRFESPGWTEFATEGATLALHATETTNPETDNLQRLPAGGCRPGLSVPNLDEFHKRMLERNVRCIQEPTPIFGARVAQYIDPDGLVISVGEERRGG